MVLLNLYVNKYIKYCMRIGYARVSTRQQADTEALDQQINRLEKAGTEEIL